MKRKFRVAIIGGEAHLKALQKISLAAENTAEALKDLTISLGEFKKTYRPKFKNWEPKYTFHS